MFGFDRENMIYRELGTLIKLGYGSYEEMLVGASERGYDELSTFLVTYGKSMYEIMLGVLPLDEIETLEAIETLEEIISCERIKDELLMDLMNMGEHGA